MAEFRIFGPPGTGKTTYLTRQIERAVDKYGNDSIMVASFTRAAARELVSRNLPITKDRCGTLHSHCFRAMGNPKIAESFIDDFNKEYPMFSLSGGSVDPDQGEFDQNMSGEGDKYMMEYQVLRAKMVDREVWPVRVRSFGEKWEEFKFKHSYVDFTDMIEICAKNPARLIPDGTRIGVFDEGQDFTPLQLNLVRAMGEHLDYFLLAGDDDQTIYGFTGATPKAFLEPEICEEQKKILNQSYRVPRTVQAVAEAWIKQIKRRQEKEYKARDFEGEVRKLMGTSAKNPEDIVDRMVEDAEEGKTAMVLASCGYMLKATIAEMRKRGLPFHNPYKTKRGDWNPLGATRGMSSKERIVEYLNPRGPQAGSARLWDVQQLAAWIELVGVDGLLNRGAKKEIKDIAEKQHDFTQAGLIKLYMEWFTPAGLNAAVELKPNFIRSRVVTAKAKTIEYPFRVYENFGLEALVETPKITVGTIHSVKGGQAQSVYLFPDLSSNAAIQYMNRTGEESIIRQFYVGMTRCSEKLTIAESCGKASVNINIR